MNFHVSVPPIKSQGIKTKLVSWIREVLPSDWKGRWVEPFLGTGVVGFNIASAKALMCDTNPHLIHFYQAISSREISPASVHSFLQQEGKLLEQKGESHYYHVRERFNEYHSPLDFLFLNRACFNGMIRFNRNGAFNVPFCRKPGRFAPAYITKIVNQVRFLSQLFQSREFEFRCQDFVTTLSQVTQEDIVYCDPPYIDRHTDYYNTWTEENELQLYRQLSSVSSRFILSTWHHNDYRTNPYIERQWKIFHVLTREHFYHLGGKEENRHPMVEALITNYEPPGFFAPIAEKSLQLMLFEHTE